MVKIHLINDEEIIVKESAESIQNKYENDEKIINITNKKFLQYIIPKSSIIYFKIYEEQVS
jgi:hypothetical protein